VTPLRDESLIFIWLDIANYSRTGFEFVLKRNKLKYLVNYYLPSGLFVIVSWVGSIGENVIVVNVIICLF
jgi:hypothetical protein